MSKYKYKYPLNRFKNGSLLDNSIEKSAHKLLIALARHDDITTSKRKPKANPKPKPSLRGPASAAYAMTAWRLTYLIQTNRDQTDLIIQDLIQKKAIIVGGESRGGHYATYKITDKGKKLLDLLNKRASLLGLSVGLD